MPRTTSQLPDGLVMRTLVIGRAIQDAYRIRNGEKLGATETPRPTDPVVSVFKHSPVAGTVLAWRRFMKDNRDVIREYVPNYCRVQWGWLRRRSMAFREYFVGKGHKDRIVSQVRINWTTKKPELMLKYPGGRLTRFFPQSEEQIEDEDIQDEQ